MNTPCRCEFLSPVLGFCLAMGISSNVFALSAGIDGFSGRPPGPDCTQAGCHVPSVPPAPVPTVTLSGPTSVAAGSTNTYTLTVSGGPGVAVGLDIAADSGTLGIGTATDIRVTAAGEIVHVAPIDQTNAPTPGTVEVMFEWTAPAMPGTAALFAAGLSSDGGALVDPTTAAGDGVATTSMSIMVTAGPAPPPPANQPPVAVISGPTAAAAGEVVTFDGTASSDPDGMIADYAWDFGDGTAGAGATVTHAFAAGTFTVTLTVTDNLGDTGSATHDIIVSAPATPLPPDPQPGGPYSGTVNTPITFDASASSDPDGTIVSYSWDFGDGNTAAGVTATNTYVMAGTFPVTLTVTDDAGLTASAQTEAVITDAAPPPPPPANPPPANPPPPVDPSSTGEQLYIQFCESCHGPGGTGGPAGDVVGESAQDIADAIIEYPEMTFLADVLTDEDINHIAMFLMPDVANGEALYIQFCESCHGVNGVGGPAGDVAGDGASDITAAIQEYPDMTFLADVLTEEDIMAIGAFLESLGEESDATGGPAGGATATPDSTPPLSGTRERSRINSPSDSSIDTTPAGGSWDGGLLVALLPWLRFLPSAPWARRTAARRR